MEGIEAISITRGEKERYVDAGMNHFLEGMINAGSIRNNLLSGEITFNTVLNILPYSNDIQIAEMNGKTLMDVLEFGCRSLPEINSGFIQVSGMEYTIDLSVDSPVVTDDKGQFLRIDGEHRVSNVMIDGEPLDPDTIYTVASSSYLLTGGDSFKMLADDAEITESTGKTDNILLSEYIEKNLNGVIPENFHIRPFRDHLQT